MTTKSKPATSAVLERPGELRSDFTYRLEANITEVMAVGSVPEGYRLDVHYTGQLITAAAKPGIVRGVDYFCIRPDGIGELDVREFIETPNGYPLAVRAMGYATSVVPVPAGGEKTFPDAPTPLTGIAFCQTTDPEWHWLNGAILTFSGTANLGTKKLEATGRVLTPELARG